MNARVPQAANHGPHLSPPLLSRFRRAKSEGKRWAYPFVAGEGHDEDLSIWRRHR
jgi:hypothetical protein